MNATLTDRRIDDRRGKGKEVGMFETMWSMVNDDRRKDGDRRAT